MDRGRFSGIRRHWHQFTLQVLTVFAVGLTFGANRTVVPVMGEETFGIESVLVIGAFVVSFGLVKAVLNLYAGKWGDAYGRKPVLIAGWLAAVPIPFIFILAPSWTWIVLGTVLLGVNQGVAWSMSLMAKLDIAGSESRGLAAGIDEAFGYAGVAIGAWLTGVIAARWTLRPAPFVFLAVVILLALAIAVVFVRETRPPAGVGSDESRADGGDSPPFGAIIKRATYGDRTLFAAAQAGHIQNFVDALVWIGFPLFLLSHGLDTAQIGLVVGIHNGAYFLQVGTGRLGDRIGRKPPIIGGLVLAGIGIAGMPLAEGYGAWIGLSALSGIGMALHYPNLITVAGDATHPRWRATGLGVYRLWRDLGYATGAVAIGLIVDISGIEAAFYAIAASMGLAAGVATLVMEETHPTLGSYPDPPASPADD